MSIFDAGAAVGAGNGSRVVQLGGRSVRLERDEPRRGATFDAVFVLPRVDASGTLASADMSRGVHVVATLPNVRKRECSRQIDRLEKHVVDAVLPAELHDVTADDDSAWVTPKRRHPGLATRAYALLRAPSEHREAFKRAFGVGVVGERRSARGLFALVDGVFVSVIIPQNQLEGPSVKLFVSRLSPWASLGSP